MENPTAAVEVLRQAGERGDADAVGAVLADDVVFHSPLTDRLTFQGRDEVVALHRDIFAVLEDLHTGEPLTRGDTQAFSFRAQVRGVELEAMNLVRCDEHGKIAELTVFIRPLPALATLFATLPPRVSTRRRGPLIGTLVACVGAPLALAFRTADRLAPKFL
ncbi:MULTISPECIES: nuclear transport factor 2 family protein [Kribbella]|uniref:SnoaL-like domain-containing protein n=1 Tax=Kribbella karoonensis TaxID=324851 RepID=A0ABN2EDH8_9ACTN